MPSSHDLPRTRRRLSSSFFITFTICLLIIQLQCPINLTYLLLDHDQVCLQKMAVFAKKDWEPAAIWWGRTATKGAESSTQVGRPTASATCPSELHCASATSTAHLRFASPIQGFNNSITSAKKSASPPMEDYCSTRPAARKPLMDRAIVSVNTSVARPPPKEIKQQLASYLGRRQLVVIYIYFRVRVCFRFRKIMQKYLSSSSSISVYWEFDHYSGC